MSNFFKIPLKIMPEVKPSGHYFGEILEGPYKDIPITAVCYLCLHTRRFYANDFCV